MTFLPPSPSPLLPSSLCAFIEITQNQDTLKRVVGLRVFKSVVLLTEGLLLSAILLPLDVIWAKAINGECEGGSNLLYILDDTWRLEGLAGFYKVLSLAPPS